MLIISLLFVLGWSGMLGSTLQHSVWSNDPVPCDSIFQHEVVIIARVGMKLYAHSPHRDGTVPAVTALKYKNALTLAVGTASGQV